MTSPAPRPRLASTRRLLINVLLASLALGLLAATLYSNREQIQAVFRRRIDPTRMGVAYLLYMVALVTTFIRWYVLVRALGLPFRLRDALRLGFIGNVFNLVIPGAVGGDLIKGAFLVREQSRKTQAIASIFIDRAIGLLGLFVLASISGAFAWAGSEREARALIAMAWGASAAGVAGLAVVFTPSLYRPLLLLLSGRPRLHAMLHELATLASSYRSRSGQVCLALLIAVACHALFVASFVLVDQALFDSVPTVGEHFVVVPLSLFSTAVPLPFGAIGLSEQVTDFLFNQIGHEGGAIAMLGYRVVIYAAGLTSVVVYLFNAKQVRELRAELPESGDPPREGVHPAG